METMRIAQQRCASRNSDTRKPRRPKMVGKPVRALSKSTKRTSKRPQAPLAARPDQCLEAGVRRARSRASYGLGASRVLCRWAATRDAGTARKNPRRRGGLDRYREAHGVYAPVLGNHHVSEMAQVLRGPALPRQPLRRARTAGTSSFRQRPKFAAAAPERPCPFGAKQAMRGGPHPLATGRCPSYRRS